MPSGRTCPYVTANYHESVSKIMNDVKTPTRVLVVDCNVDAAEILGILLGAYGFESRVVCSKTAALEVVQSFRPHAVVIDLGQDTMDTFEMAAALRNIPQLEGVYLITILEGNLPMALQDAALKIDVRLTKPTAYRMLIDTLKGQFVM